MQNARTTLAIFAFAAMFGSTVQAPASPTKVQHKLDLPATEATVLLARNLTRRFAQRYDEPAIDVVSRSFENLLGQLERKSISYFISSHMPARADLWAAPLATDGIAFIVNPNNPLSDLGLDDLRDILIGSVTNWRELSGQTLPISPFTVSPGSDTYLEVQRMLTGATSMTGNALLVPSFAAMLENVAEAPGAIGYAPLTLVDSTVKVLAIQGQLPSQHSVNNQLYPLRSTIFIIGRQEPPASFRNLIGWIQSEKGQAVVAESHAALP